MRRALTSTRVPKMLATKGNTQPGIGGMDQQSFREIELVAGCYPFQIGLQKRIPGKTLQRLFPEPVGSIYVFYNVYGRTFSLIDFGTLQIEEVVVPPITIPGLPPQGNSWFDTFQGYTVGAISRLWGGGAWNNSVGIAETIIQGFIDPFLVYDTLPPGYVSGPPPPIADPPPEDDPTIPPASPESPGFLYPPGTIDIVLKRTFGLSDNSCTGQGTQPLNAVDVVYYYSPEYPNDPIVNGIGATAITVGATVTWFHGLRIGRSEDIDGGYYAGTCPGAPHPIPVKWFLQDDGQWGIDENP